MLRPALTLLSAGLVSAMVVTGCGVRVNDGPTVHQDRAVAPFQRIALDGSPDVDVVLGDHTRVVVRAGRDVVGQIRTEVRDGTLHIDREDHDTFVFDENAPHIQVEVPRLEAAEVHGSGDVDIDLAGRAMERLDLAVQGSGDVSARGRVDTLHVAVDGSGDMDLGDLHARDAAVAIHGSGDADVRVEGALRANVEGSGDVRYRGPAQVASDVEGSGDVRRED
jgi:hypothetical protein